MENRIVDIDSGTRNIFYYYATALEDLYLKVKVTRIIICVASLLAHPDMQFWTKEGSNQFESQLWGLFTAYSGLRNNF